jgi:hypothetical protein
MTAGHEESNPQLLVEEMARLYGLFALILSR